MYFKRLFSIAAASLGLGIAVIVDQPAAFARCDRGTCPCRDESWTGDSVNHNKCRADQFCAQKITEKYGSDHVYQCQPAKPGGWGCTDDRQCKSRKCFTRSVNFETSGKCAASQVCYSDYKNGRYSTSGQVPPKNASPEAMRRFCCDYNRSGDGKYCEAKNGRWQCKEAPYPKNSFYCINGKICGVGGYSKKASIENCKKVCEDTPKIRSTYGRTYEAKNQCGIYN